MGAFNGRFQTKSLWGLPLWSMAGIFGLLISIFLSLILPYPFRVLTMVLAGLCFVLVGLGFWFGEDLSFIPVMWAAKKEANRVTSETWTEE